ncbi:hypothetical protein [Porphyromonas pogonae]|uniref:hypothetical protein n=1 Tax=Porphyromonas pogonae TaxID=867595 RepID=UPI002E75D158|nr:hypothetical protein [Porphyromonas pogonae]
MNNKYTKHAFALCLISVFIAFFSSCNTDDGPINNKIPEYKQIVNKGFVHTMRLTRISFNTNNINKPLEFYFYYNQDSKLDSIKRLIDKDSVIMLNKITDKTAVLTNPLKGFESSYTSTLGENALLSKAHVKTSFTDNDVKGEIVTDASATFKDNFLSRYIINSTAVFTNAGGKKVENKSSSNIHMVWHNDLIVYADQECTGDSAVIKSNYNGKVHYEFSYPGTFRNPGIFWVLCSFFNYMVEPTVFGMPTDMCGAMGVEPRYLPERVIIYKDNGERLEHKFTYRFMNDEENVIEVSDISAFPVRTATVIISK